MEPLELTFEVSSKKQKEAAIAWIDPSITDIVYGGAKGGGKSYLGASLIFSQALVYPGTRYFIARKQLIDLRIHTIPTIDKVFAGWKIRITDYGKFNGQDHCYYFNNGSSVLLIDAKEMPGDPLYERFGSMEMTQGWIEEAGEFSYPAMVNLSISIGRCFNDKYNIVGKLLQTCNPKKNYLYKDYYLPWKSGTLPKDKKFIQAFAHDNKKNESGYVQRLSEKLKGTERQRLLDGNWEYATDTDCLIEYDKILDLFTNAHVVEGDKKITVDAARLGGDRIVIIEWNGWRGKVKWYKKQTLDVTGSIVEELRYKLKIGVSDVVVDEDGLGGGLVDFLKFKGFVNNSSPLPSPAGPKDSNNNPIKENYDNLKSQCYFRLSERINKNGIFLECEDEEIKQLVIEELEQVRQKDMDGDGKKGVVPKDKVKEILGRSPDFADAIMMREYFELKPKRSLIYV